MSKVKKSDEQWREQLTPEQYRVLRQKGTEAPYTGALLNNHEQGTYSCAACGQKIFGSEHKFDSHCGWPSFYDAIAGTVTLTHDTSHGMQRTEITCSSCGGHLGHIFEGEGYDTPTDQRYCVNSVSLRFDKV